MENSLPMKKMVRCREKYTVHTPAIHILDTRLKHYTGIYFICLENKYFWVLVACFFFFHISAEDEEDTIAAQEKVEGNVDHAEELDDLAKEGRCF